MNEMKYLVINKNRGWRGLAEIDILDEENKVTTSHIFSFSEPMWHELIHNHKVVIASDKYYYVIKFDNRDRLPGPTQQRSVLIKNFMAAITKVNKYAKDATSITKDDTDETYADKLSIAIFRKNKNNHTTSDWNCIGLRVVPKI